MEINRFKITDEQMSTLVTKFFIKDEINRERHLQNMLNKEGVFKNVLQFQIPDLEVDLNFKIEISALDYLVLFKDFQIENTYSKDRSYFSLISDNAANELRILPLSVLIMDDTIESEIFINLDNTISVTNHYIFDNNKYTFIN